MKKLDKEMQKTDKLLYSMIPRTVADRLRSGDLAVNTCEVVDPSCMQIVFQLFHCFVDFCHCFVSFSGQTIAKDVQGSSSVTHNCLKFYILKKRVFHKKVPSFKL